MLEGTSSRLYVSLNYPPMHSAVVIEPNATITSFNFEPYSLSFDVSNWNIEQEVIVTSVQDFIDHNIDTTSLGIEYSILSKNSKRYDYRCDGHTL